MKRAYQMFFPFTLLALFIFTGIRAEASVRVYDYDSSCYLSLSRDMDDSANHAFQRTTSLKKSGQYSGRFELRPGERRSNDRPDQERTELSEDHFLLPENTSQFYSFSIYIPASELNDCQSASDCKKWRNYMQWHSKPADNDWRHPVLTLSLDKKNLSFILAKQTYGSQEKWYEKIVTLPVQPDTWMNFIVHFKWSRSPDKGMIQIMLNEKMLIDLPNKSVGYSDQNSLGIYWKHGIYREAAADTDIVYFDELKRGDSYEEVTGKVVGCAGSSAPLSAVRFLLGQSPPRRFSPDAPNQKAASENIVQLSGSSWQRIYSTPETYCQLAKKTADTVKIKFGQMHTGGENGFGYITWFDVERNIPFQQQPDGAPFNVEQFFPGYEFMNCHNPGDDEDIWTCKVKIQGYNL